MSIAKESIAGLIDHAVLHPTQTDDDLRAACAMGIELGVKSICVKPYAVSLAAELLAGSGVLVSTVISFPHGNLPTAIKRAEANLACENGAQELDMVVNLGKVLSEDWEYVEADIRAVVEAGRASGAITKVIFETGLLPSDELKVRLCQISEQAGAAFVKTSTGFGFVKGVGGMQSTGATEHDVRLMRASCGPTVQVKASGGIRTLAEARKMVEFGATRLGTSNTAAICAEERGGSRASEQSSY